ncbi:MAG: TlpA disulfide reductase family protein [Cytophagales bacterium]|nr:TlpA disulfide reductase family protein [Cytophagales bacterium]
MKAGRHPIYLLVSSALLLIFFLPACSPKREQTQKAQESQVAPEWRLHELDGQSIDLASFRGKAVVINVWATWCKPCILEMPTFARAMKEMKSQPVVFLFASNEEPDLIRKFAEKNTYDFHYVHLENLEELGIQALPTTFIFSPQGKLSFKESGFRTWDDPKNLELIQTIMKDHEE